MKKFKLLNFRNFAINQKLLRTMKLTLLFLTACFLQVSATVYSQNTKFTFDVKNKRVVDILRDIEDQSEFRFFYQREQVNVERKIDLEITNQTVENILTKIFSEENIEFQVRNDNLILLKPAGMTFGTIEFLAENGLQQRTVSGTVTDEYELPLPGVTVLVKGTTQGTVTNSDGNYSLTNIPEDATLVFSFVGMRTQEVEVGNQTSIDVVMEVDAIGIEEVVAIGYGTARRKDITGSVSSVNMEDSPISIAPNFNALSSLKATTPGLNIGTVNSAGGSPSLLIRGQNSISGSNAPLIVLDGVIFLGSINDINPNDIATYDILKDASATAVYGSRAANGVIIITTKKGKAGKPVIRLNTSTGINVWQQKPNVMSPERYLEKRMDRSGVDDPLSIPELKVPERESYLAGETNDWIDLGSRIGLNQNYQLSVSGRGEGINYFLSTGYIEQEGVLLGDDYNQVALRGKIDTDITNWLQIGVDGSYNYRDYSGLGVNMQSLVRGAPYGDVYVKNWDEKILEKFPTGESITNPLWNTEESIVDDVNRTNFYRLSGFAHIKIPFIEGLSYRLNYVRGNNVNNTERFYYEGYFVNEGYGTTDPIDRYGPEALQSKLSSANGYMGRRIRFDYVWDNILNFKRQLGEHYIDATLVATRDYIHNKYIQIDGNDFAANGNTSLGANGLHKADVQSYNITLTEEANIGYLARLSYSFSDKYHVTASYRRDGSSVFGADKKWGNFPSIGFAWTATEEDIFNSINILDYLKIKASYGKNGNQGISAYNTLTRMTSGRDGNIRYEFGDEPSKVLYGMVISSLGNPLLGWETTTSFNGGIESVLYDNRIFFNLDFYFSKTFDQLFVRQIPIMTGFSSIRSSMGQVNNRGIEISLNSTNLQSQNFSWKSGLTFWQNRNILDKLYGDDIDGDGVEDDDIGNNLFIGKSLGAVYGYEFDGIVQEDDTEYINNTGAEPGHVKFTDIIGPDGVPDGLISSEYDRKILGYTKENFRLNLSNTVNFKNFEFYMLIQGIFGGGKDNYYMLDNLYAFRMLQQPAQNDWDHPWWTPENKNNSYPSTTYFDGRFPGIQSRSFVRIQDITLSYRFDQNWIRRMNFESLKIYSSIQNLYTFTRWEGGDPEQGVRAMSGTYPVTSIYTIGLDISF